MSASSVHPSASRVSAAVCEAIFERSSMKSFMSAASSLFLREWRPTSSSTRAAFAASSPIGRRTGPDTPASHPRDGSARGTPRRDIPWLRDSPYAARSPCRTPSARSCSHPACDWCNRGRSTPAPDSDRPWSPRRTSRAPSRTRPSPRPRACRRQSPAALRFLHGREAGIERSLRLRVSRPAYPPASAPFCGSSNTAHEGAIAPSARQPASASTTSFPIRSSHPYIPYHQPARGLCLAESTKPLKNERKPKETYARTAGIC